MTKAELKLDTLACELIDVLREQGMDVSDYRKKLKEAEGEIK
jgi:hypothetical protein